MSLLSLKMFSSLNQQNAKNEMNKTIDARVRVAAHIQV